MKFLIKTYGHGGSGKSTIIKELKTLLKDNGHKVADNSVFLKLNKTKRYLLSLLYSLNNKRSFKKVKKLLSSFYKTRFFSYKAIIIYFNAVKLQFVRNLIFRKSNAKFYLFDQGSICQLSTIDHNELKSLDFNLFFSSLYREEGIVPVIVFVDTPVVESKKRIFKDLKSKRPELFSKNRNEIERLYENGEKNFKLFSRFFEDDERINFIKVNGTKSPRENAKKIYEYILKING